ncbi:lipopolysaccharide biosynthesis protein [Streptomyces sp. NPDC049881]|uniref:lipopolysaccharide biosynthesis protein n=1 Tax=Streptomyces sp. NPDC049881 TaxID=3155778 RepID=UPI003435A111
MKGVQAAKGRLASALPLLPLWAGLVWLGAVERARKAARRLPGRGRPWTAPALGLLLGVAAGASYAAVTEREYAASGFAVVAAAEGTEHAEAVGIAQSYGRIATSDAVLRTAHTDAGVDTAVLRGRVSAVTSPDAPVIEITGRAPDARDAARAANAVARALARYADAAAEATGTDVRQIAEAVAPAEPVTPRPVVSAAVGGCAGAVVGCLVPLARRQGRPGGGGGGTDAGDRPPLPAQPGSTLPEEPVRLTA